MVERIIERERERDGVGEGGRGGHNGQIINREKEKEKFYAKKGNEKDFIYARIVMIKPYKQVPAQTSALASPSPSRLTVEVKGN